MDMKLVKKISFFINTVLLVIVIFLMLFFYICKATFLVYFSIPTILVYLLSYILIYKEYLDIYLQLVYLWIIIYMTLSTICLGYDYGFHLYSLSLIPIIYYANYIAYKINTKKIATWVYSVAIIACYLGGTVYVAQNGPIYKESHKAAGVFWISNSIFVFFFLIFYTKTMVSNTIASEEKLKKMSYYDNLTGLFNRHYMMDCLNSKDDISANDTVAMLDIDDFKKINDVYGHNGGDYVLKKLSEIMNDTCTNGIISRWGGEEFLILLKPKDITDEIFEKLRKAVNEAVFEFEGKRINVTITIGVARRSEASSIDKWIQAADQKLYIGKNSGKNVVIS
ncbi:diguanylate cyclase (GGDEF) domain-containing protein [Eubacterium ruminantium]|nr:diguanylate cyclase (GGDEF) domain-containing protein [Eubacterium ruminantium]